MNDLPKKDKSNTKTNDGIMILKGKNTHAICIS